MFGNLEKETHDEQIPILIFVFHRLRNFSMNHVTMMNILPYQFRLPINRHLP